MAAGESTFVTQFHLLPGNTIKEKQQNLFQLLRKNSNLEDNQKELDLIAANLEPTNHLEHIFYVDFLIYFRRFTELYKNFRRGDDITVKKVSKHEWFYQSAYKEVDTEEFVCTILPTLSYSLKRKVLKKLPVDEHRADEIFEALQKRYGTFLATDFLPKCTSTKIRETLRHNQVKLTQRQLRLLYKKDPDLIDVYFEERSEYEKNLTFLRDNKQILTYIAQNNPEMFSNLLDKYKFEIELGRRTTKNYITSQKDQITNKLEDYINILNTSVAVRKLGTEVKSILFKNSKRTHQFYWYSLLKHYPKNQQFKIYQTMYDSIHHQKFGENVDTISENIIKIISDIKERERIVKLKLEKDDNHTYLKYVSPEYCFEEYMAKINHMRYHERAEFVQIATECCVLNKDLIGLLKMCELVAVRFKNDERRVRESFFSSLEKDTSLMNKFTEQHWNFINEILETANHNSEWIFSETTLRVKRIKFLLKNNNSIKEIISKYDDWAHILLSDDLKGPEFFKPILNELIETGCLKPNELDPTSVQKYDCTLAYLCKIYNERNPHDIIAIYDHPRVLKSIKEVLEQDTSSYVGGDCVSGIEYVICRSSSSKEIQELKNLYFKAYTIFSGKIELMWFLKHEPETLQNNMDDIINVFGQDSVTYPEYIWRYFKKYSFLEFVKKIVEVCKLKLGEEEFRHKSQFTKGLAILETPDSYLEFIKSFIPTSAKVDLTDKKVKNLYSIQTNLVRYVHFANCPAKLLPVVMEFCKGDYLKYASSSLHSCIYKLPENETKLFIEKLNGSQGIAVKKHALNLSCVIYDINTVYNCLKNTSLPSLGAALKYFAKNPSDSLWQLVETKINSIEKKDLQMCQSVVDIVVPLKYRSKFVEALWKLLDKYEDREMKKTLMNNIDKNTIKRLNPEFAFQIIRDSIFKLKGADDLIANLLIYVNDGGKYSVFATALRELRENDWNRIETRRDARNELNRLILNLFRKYLKAEKKEDKFESELLTSFKSVFSLSETFEEHIVISSMAFKGEPIEYCGKILLEFNNHIGKHYNNYVVNLFADTINKYVFNEVFTTQSERIELCYSLLKMRGSFDDDLLILKLLPSSTPADTEHFLLYDDILKFLSQSDDNVVQLQLNLYLRSKA